MVVMALVVKQKRHCPPTFRREIKIELSMLSQHMRDICHPRDIIRFL